MEPFALILAAMLAQTEAGIVPPPPPSRASSAETYGDGTVTRGEWIAQFERLDADHDGKLSREERRAGRPPRLDRQLDTDGGRPRRSGRGEGPVREMTRADYLARAGERFDRMDADRDGRIDPAEMRASRGRWRGPDAQNAVPDGER